MAFMSERELRPPEKLRMRSQPRPSAPLRTSAKGRGKGKIL